MYDSWDAGTWAWMVVVMLLFVGALIFGIFAVVRTSDRDRHRDRSTPQAPEDALGVLDDRFARGEIDAEEYAERRRILTGRQGSDPRLAARGRSEIDSA
jgi:putative membrane protein